MKKFLFFFSFIVSLYSSAIDTNSLCNLIADAAHRPIFKDSDIDSNFYLKNKADLERSINALRQLELLPPKDALPSFYEILESGVIDKFYCTVPVEKGALVFTNDFMEIGLNSVLSDQIWLHSDFCFGFVRPGSLISPWLNQLKFNRFIPTTIFCRFWWYEGRRYMPVIWEHWYKCWTEEMLLKRKLVVEELTSDILSVGFNSFPYLYSSFKNGDNSLTNVFNEFGHLLFKYKIDNFSSWWEENSKNYVLPECETIEILTKRIGLEKTKTILPQNASVLANIARNFYNSDFCASNYWYYYLNNKDSVSEEDIRDAYDKASNYINH